MATKTLTVYRRRQIALLVAALTAIAGCIWGLHDAFLLAMLVAAAGLIWSSREWQAFLLAALMVAVGLWWSRIDLTCCSVWWRGQIVVGKLLGHFPYLQWKDIKRPVLGPYHGVICPRPSDFRKVVWLESRGGQGGVWQLYQTDLGQFWLPAPDKELLAMLVWEITVQRDYESGEVVIRPGDTVIDCGAHVGVFTKYALRRGAGRVIAIEPDPANLPCLELNLATEITQRQVIVVKAGLWDKEARLRLFENTNDNSGRSSFLLSSPGDKEIEGVLAFPLDEVVRRLELDRVDFIKMDIEGAERFALRGATETMARFKPRMAICAYHFADDTSVIPAIVTSVVPTYRIHAKDIELFAGDPQVNTKALFFH